MNPSAENPPPPPAPTALLNVVRYSLPELLAEVQAERRAPTYASEQLEQVEIAKLFKKNRPTRANRDRE